jgi:hypothetical protein
MPGDDLVSRVATYGMDSEVRLLKVSEVSLFTAPYPSSSFVSICLHNECLRLHKCLFLIITDYKFELIKSNFTATQSHWTRSFLTAHVVSGVFTSRTSVLPAKSLL